MAIAFPPEWSVLEHPNMRHELIVWVAELVATPEAPIDLEGLITFLVDLTDLATNTSGEVGYTLFDLDEANAVTEFTQAAVSLDRRDSHLAVQELRRVARKTHEILISKGIPVLS